MVINKNLKKGSVVHEKVAEGGRRQLFVPKKSEMVENEEVGETVKSKLKFVKALRSKEKPRDFLARLGGQHFFADEGEETNFEKDFLEASIMMAERKPNYRKRKLLNSSLLYTMFLLVKREYEETDDEVAKQMFRDIFKSESAFFETIIAEMDRSDEVEEMFKSQEATAPAPRKKSVRDEDREVGLEEGVEELCELFENDTFLEKSKVVKVFEAKFTKILQLGVRLPVLRNKIDAQGLTMMRFQKEDCVPGSKTFTKVDSTKSSGGGNTTSAQCIIIKLRDLPHELREKVLTTFDDKGYMFNEDLEKQVNDKEDSDLAEALSQQSGTQSSQQEQPKLRYCRLCDFSTRSRPDLEDHMGGEHETCNICKRIFKGKDELNEHKQEEHNRTKCVTCGKMVQARALERHIEEHTTQAKIAKGKKIQKSKTAQPRVNPYVEFCRQERPLIKADHPLYSFGEINKELGKRWGALSDGEKRAFKNIREEELDEPGQNEVAADAAAAAILRREREAAIEETERIQFEEIEQRRLATERENEERLATERENEERLATERENEDRLATENEERLLQELEGRQVQEMDEVEKAPETEPEAATGALQKEFKCPECEEKFRSTLVMKSHIKDVHKKKPTTADNAKNLKKGFNCPYPECDQLFEKAKNVKDHLAKEHKKKQPTLDGVRGQLIRGKIVIFKPSGKLMWPAEVVSETENDITVQIFNKSRSVKTTQKNFVEPFDYDEHSTFISANNSEHRWAFRMARSATGK